MHRRFVAVVKALGFPGQMNHEPFQDWLDAGAVKSPLARVLLATAICLTGASGIEAQMAVPISPAPIPASPTPNPLPSATAMPSPTAAPSVTAPPSPTSVPGTSASPSATVVPSVMPSATIPATPSPPPLISPVSPPSATPVPPFPVPPPNPAPMVEQPALPPVAPFVSDPPDPARVARAIPAVTVLRFGSNDPQQPQFINGRYEIVFLTGSEPATLILRFAPALAGSPLLISGNDGVTMQGQNSEPEIGPTGEAVLLVQLTEGYSSGRLVVRVDQVTTVLRLARASAAVVASHENQTAKD